MQGYRLSRAHNSVASMQTEGLSCIDQCASARGPGTRERSDLRLETLVEGHQVAASVKRHWLEEAGTRIAATLTTVICWARSDRRWPGYACCAARSGREHASQTSAFSRAPTTGTSQTNSTCLLFVQHLKVASNRGCLKQSAPANPVHQAWRRCLPARQSHLGKDRLAIAFGGSAHEPPATGGGVAGARSPPAGPGGLSGLCAKSPISKERNG